MISDLHINDCTESYLKKVYHRVDRMIEIINRHMDSVEMLIVVMCGDVVDCGKKEYFYSAQKIFNHIKKKAGEERVEFVMVPGNHDLCDNGFCSFDDFDKKYCNDVKGIFETDSCCVKSVENFNFILANSTYHRDYNYGKVDFDAIEKSASPLLDNILITHHSTVSEDDNDVANIRNIPRLIDVINRNQIRYHFHGHTHGTFWTRIGNEGNSLGVGAMLFKAEEMGSQFHLITIEQNRIVKIVNYIYLVDRDKYISDLVYNETNIDINEITGIEQDYILRFQCPENYIFRQVGPYDIVQRGGIGLYYNKEQIKSLYDLMIEKERIVLIGEAGSGKSYELQNLAYMIARSKKALPVFVKLNTYVDETIEELISTEVEHDYKGSTVLIFDGFDEIEEQNLNSFTRRINTFVKKNPKQRIVISTRNNFYRNALEETKLGTFYDFYECSLCLLSNTDIDKYLEGNGIESTLFMKEVKNKNLKEQVYSPFYLSQLSNLFKSTGSLQKIDKLMGELIADSFEQDKNKYITTKDIEGCKREVIKNLEILAFAMQCMRKTSLSLEEYQELISREERKIIKYCGVLKQTGEGRWEFEHNNFREYLAAEYIRDIPLDKVIHFVTYKGNKRRIKSSWMNVLSFAVMIYPKHKLFDWIVKTEPSIVVKFESSRLKEDTRTNIFCNIMDKYKRDNVWISRDWNNEEDLAKFGQTEKSILYLLKEIRKPHHFRSLSNAIHIIGQMTDYLGKSKEVRNALLECCFNENTRSYEIVAAITALTNQALYNKDDIQKLLDFFCENYDSDIREALYCYIFENDLQDDAIDFVLDGIKNLDYNDTKAYRMQRSIEDIVQSLEKYESIKKVFGFLLDKLECYLTMELFEHLLEGLFKKAETFFKNGKLDILLFVQKIFWKSSITCETNIMKNARIFLVNTNQIFSTYEWVLQQPYNIYFNHILENIVDERCIDDFANKYKNNLLQNKEMFISFVKRSRKNSYRNNEFVKLVFQMDAIEIEKEELIDYDKLRKEGEQKYFDALFDQNVFQKLIEEVAELCNGEETTYKDLEDMRYKRAELRYDLEKVKWAIFKNNFYDTKVINFLDYIHCWKDFSIEKIYKEIKEKSRIKISDEQIRYIKEYCLKTVEQINFNEEIVYKKDGTGTYSMRCVVCVFFANYFAFDYRKEIIMNMLLINPYLFGNEKKDSVFADYIIKRIESDMLKQQICSNLKNGKVKGDLAEPYFEYCLRNNMEDALELAEMILKDCEYREWVRKKALDYIAEIKSYNYIMDSYLEDTDITMLNLMVDKFNKFKDERLIQRMITENQASMDGFTFLKRLIEAESEFGLERYYRMAKEKNAVPDLNQDVCEITEAVGEISEKKSIDIVIKLVLLQFQEGFQDKRYFGLYNSTYKALKNIAQNNSLNVIQYLKKVKKDNYDNLELRSYCSHLLMEIEEEYYNKEDKSWTIIEVKEYITSQNISMQSSGSDEKRSGKIIKDLVSVCIKLQANSIYYGASENQRNDFVRDLLEISGYDVKDQTRRGISHSGKEAGEIDILLKENELPITIIEALNLSCLNTTYLNTHIKKVYDYDTAGNEFNVLLVYVTVKDFNIFCNKYIQHIREFCYPYPMITVEDITEDFTYSDIMIFKTVLNRNNHETELYHFCVLIGK